MPIKIIEVQGNSMEPKLKDKNLVLVRNNNRFKVSDLICFRYNGKLLIKRLVGIGGDHITITDNELYRNGILAHKFQIEINQAYDWNIPKGTVAILGDNLQNSLDSRKIGFIPTKDVVGKAIFRIWTPKFL